MTSALNKFVEHCALPKKFMYQYQTFIAKLFAKGSVICHRKAAEIEIVIFFSNSKRFWRQFCIPQERC